MTEAGRQDSRERQEQTGVRVLLVEPVKMVLARKNAVRMGRTRQHSVPCLHPRARMVKLGDPAAPEGRGPREAQST